MKKQLEAQLNLAGDQKKNEDEHGKKAFIVKTRKPKKPKAVEGKKEEEPETKKEEVK